MHVHFVIHPTYPAETVLSIRQKCSGQTEKWTRVTPCTLVRFQLNVSKALFAGWVGWFKLSVGVTCHPYLLDSRVYLLKDGNPVGLSASRSVRFSEWTVLIGRTGFGTIPSISDPTMSLSDKNCSGCAGNWTSVSPCLNLSLHSVHWVHHCCGRPRHQRPREAGAHTRPLSGFNLSTFYETRCEYWLVSETKQFSG